jgi:hypothetical protein
MLNAASTPRLQSQSGDQAYRQFLATNGIPEPQSIERYLANALARAANLLDGERTWLGITEVIAGMTSGHSWQAIDGSPSTDSYVHRFDGWSLSVPHATLLVALLRDMAAHDVRVTVLITPTSAPCHANLRQIWGYERSMSDIKSLLDEVERQQPLVHACYPENATTAGCLRSDLISRVRHPQLPRESRCNRTL